MRPLVLPLFAIALLVGLVAAGPDHDWRRCHDRSTACPVVVSQVFQPNCCTQLSPTPSPTPTVIPTVLRAGFIIQPGASALPDPGFTPLDDLAQAVDFNQDATVAGSCAGGSTHFACYKYEDFALNKCATFAERDVWATVNASDETAFMHQYPGGITSGNRLPNLNSPTATPCPSPNVGTTNGGDWNPVDSGLAAAINTALANSGTNYFPAGYHQLFEDDGQGTGQFACGIGSSMSTTSTEYGLGYNSGRTQICNQTSTSPHNVGTDYGSALGTIASRLTYPVWMNGFFPCCGDPTGCSIIASGHCHDVYFAGYIDDSFYAMIHNACATAGGNLKFGLMENAIMHKYPFALASALTLIAYVNTASGLVNDSTCAALTLVDFEYGYGLGGPGDLSGSPAVLELVTAMQGLVPDPATGIPDRIAPEYSGVTCAGATHISNNPCTVGQQETPYFFNETLVPQGPLHAVAPFAWNGIVQSLGGGCDGTTDSGGAVALKVACVGTSPILVQQYLHLYINGTDYGPAAYVVNTSSTTQNMVSGWFTDQPISLYHYRLALQAGEVGSIPYGGGTLSLICTYTVNCVGSSSPASNMATFKGDGTDMLCGQCGTVLFARN